MPASLPRRFATKFTRIAIAHTTPVKPRTDLVRLGSSYGGWWVPADLLNSNSICYLAGLGEDASFDLALLNRFGCECWAVDPTPRAIEYAATIKNSLFHFIPVGLWGQDENGVKFHAPADSSHVSHSIGNIQGGDTFFRADCWTVKTMMNNLSHPRVDLLKLDIEGAEVDVLEDLLRRGPLPQVLLVEFDAPESIGTAKRRLRLLKASGYVCVRIESRNYTFVRAEHGEQ